jgi:SAM-dependent methyltransferase
VGNVDPPSPFLPSFIDPSTQLLTSQPPSSSAFAINYPHTTILGNDLSPIQPTWIPPNLTFELDDLTSPWLHPTNTFDFIHMRCLLGSVPDWHGLLREAHRCCKPGGWAESLEVSCVFRSDDGTLVEGSPMEQWGRVFVEAGRRLGRPFDVVGGGGGGIVRDAFVKAGFGEIVEWEYKVGGKGVF